jgi:hypothetical protein
MSFMACVIGTFKAEILKSREGGGGFKYVFLGLRQQLRYQAEGKNVVVYFCFVCLLNTPIYGRRRRMRGQQKNNIWVAGDEQV